MKHDAAEQRVFREAARTLLGDPTSERFSFQDPLRNARFLDYLVETQPVVLHGSPEPGLAVLEPRTWATVGGVHKSVLFASRSLAYVAAWMVAKIFGDRQMFEFDYSVRIFAWTLRSRIVSISRSILTRIHGTAVPIYVCPAGPFSRVRGTPRPAAERMSLGMVKKCPEFYTEERVVPLGWVPVDPSALPYVTWLHAPTDGKGQALLRNLLAPAATPSAKRSSDRSPWRDAPGCSLPGP